MSDWTQLKLVSRNDVDRKNNFSTEVFLKVAQKLCKTEMTFSKSEYKNRNGTVIGFTFNISIRDSICGKSTKEFVDSFIKQSPYFYIMVVDGILYA